MSALTFRDGTVVKADRALGFLVGNPIAFVLGRADRWNWKVELSPDEVAQLAAGGVGEGSRDAP